MSEHNMTGTDHSLMMVCLTRMGGMLAMDLGMPEEDFTKFAMLQYRQIPLTRKQPSNVVQLVQPKDKS